MPATILTSLLLCSSFLLPGAKNDETRDLASNLASCHSMTMIAGQTGTIQALPIEKLTPWALSEATSEQEEESTDSDDHVIVAERCWILARTGLQGPASTILLTRGFACPPGRSTILRC